MNRLTCGAIALAFGLSSFAATAMADDMPAGVTCYLLGCYDADGNKIDPVKTGSLAAEGARAVDAVRKAKDGAKGGGRSHIDGLIERHAQANGVPAAVARAVVRVESNYRVTARGSAGEIGLMQIKPSTARMMGYRGSVKGLFDPETNIRYGMKYLGMAHKLGGGAVCETILKYNAGHAARRMNPVSRAYCAKVKRHMSS